METKISQLTAQEYKDTVAEIVSSRGGIRKMDLVCDLKRTADELGLLGRLMTLLILEGAVVGPISLINPTVGIEPLSIAMGIAFIAQILFWKLGLGWIDILAKMTCSPVITYNEASPFIAELSDLWKEYAPEEEKTGKYRRQISDAEDGRNLSAPNVVTIVHCLRSWISQAERRQMIEEEKKRIAREFMEGEGLLED